MKILVALVTSHKKAKSDFLKHEEQILNTKCLPKDLQDQVKFEAKLLDPQGGDLSLQDLLLNELDNWDAIALLIDRQWAADAQAVRSAFFVGEIDLSGYIPNLPNVLSSISARLLKNFGTLLVKMSDSTNEQAASLPFRNFHAAELCELGRVCSELALDGNFRNEIEPLFARLLSRRGPKRRSKYPTAYFVDDSDKYFEYGKEHHARLGTGSPHVSACRINGNMRFGRRIDSTRHFNVTQGDKDKSVIAGSFPNCHDALVKVAGHSHLNMFSNDFH